MQNAIELSRDKRLRRRASLPRWKCFVHTPVDHKPLWPKSVPSDQNQDSNNRNGNSYPLFHFSHLLDCKHFGWPFEMSSSLHRGCMAFVNQRHHPVGDGPPYFVRRIFLDEMDPRDRDLDLRWPRSDGVEIRAAAEERA